MKKKLLCAIAVVSAVSCFTAGVFANVKLETISAYLNHGISIAKGGEIVTLLDSNGNKMTPITYNDSTYLPVRAISNLLGHEIGWDAQMQCVSIDNSAVPDIIIPDITQGRIEMDFLNKLIDKVGNGKLKLNYTDLPPGLVTSMSRVEDGIYYGWSVHTSGVAFSYNALDVVTVDGAPADEIEAFYQAFKDALIANGYTYVKTDEEGFAHYVNGEAEFTIKNFDNKSFPVFADTSYMSCCAEGSDW